MATNSSWPTVRNLSRPRFHSETQNRKYKSTLKVSASVNKLKMLSTKTCNHYDISLDRWGQAVLKKLYFTNERSSTMLSSNIAVSSLPRMIILIMLMALVISTPTLAQAGGKAKGGTGTTTEAGTSHGDQNGSPANPGKNNANSKGCQHGEPECTDSPQPQEPAPDMPEDTTNDPPEVTIELSPETTTGIVSENVSASSDPVNHSASNGAVVASVPEIAPPAVVIPYTFNTDVGELAANDVALETTDVVTYQVSGETLIHPVTVAVDLAGNNSHFSFEPNGARGVFSNSQDNRTNLVLGASRDSTWYQMLSDVNAGVHLIHAVWSPTNNGILFTEHVIYTQGKTVSAHIYKTDQRGPNQLKVDMGAEGFWMDISPDGQLFAFTERTSGTLHIGSMYADQAPQPVFDNEGLPIHGIRWNWAADGQSLYGFDSAAGEWFCLDLIDDFQLVKIDTATVDIAVDPDYIRSETAFVIAADSWTWFDSAPMTENQRILAIARTQLTTEVQNANHDNLDWVKADIAIPEMAHIHYELWRQLVNYR